MDQTSLVGPPSADVPDADLVRVFRDLGFVTGSSGLLPLLRRTFKSACVSDTTLIIEGETGTGKQVLANAIHQLDRKRCGGQFVTVHCSTITDSLAESELFGHRRGAFSGAVSDRGGLFQAAHRGTLFLDDVNDLPLRLQPKLLDVLQRGAIRPVGADRETRVDVRVIAACNLPLKPLVERHLFREDLYHRLNVVKLQLPALRARRCDIPDLALAFAHRHRSLYHPIDGIEPALIRALDAHPFPGNVRELENTVQRMLFAKSAGTTLTLADWMNASDVASEPGGVDLAGAVEAAWQAILRDGVPWSDVLREIERRLLEMALTAGGTRREIAARLRTSERTLYHKLRAHSVVRLAAGVK
jgi:DNA-binding NtrC family response regulator